jgi:hypothetical protein
VAVLVGLCANVPWIMLPWYALTTAGAAALLGISIDGAIAPTLTRFLDLPFYGSAFWGQAGDLIEAVFWPFLIGPTAGAAVLGVVTYAAASRILVRRAARRSALADPADTVSAILSRDAQERTADRHVGDAQSTRLNLQESAEEAVDRARRYDDVGTGLLGGGEPGDPLAGPDGEHQRKQDRVRVGDALDPEAGTREHAAEPSARRPPHFRAKQ